jgi:chromosome segregation ATPase
MAENGNGKFDWRVVGLSLALILGQGLILGGIFWATLQEHARRLDENQAEVKQIQRRMEERSVAREEYERRHDDLQKQVEANRQAIRELEKKVR